MAVYPNTTDRLLDAEAGADFLGIRANTLRKWARQGHVESVRVRGVIRFRLSDLQKLIIKSPRTTR